MTDDLPASELLTGKRRDTLHFCGSSALERRPSTVRTRRPGRPLIDLHCHYLDAAAEEVALALPDCPRSVPDTGTAAGRTAAYNQELIETSYRMPFTDLETRLADMDAMGVDVQALSPSPTQYHYWAPEEGARAIVASINVGIAEACERHPERFVGLGTVSLQHPRAAVEQLRHAMKDLALRGVEISTRVNDLPIDDPSFDPFWQAAEELGAAVIVHPLGTTVGRRLDDHYLSNVIGNPLETTIAVSRLILGGHFDRHPLLKLCAVHGGGFLPLYASRIDHAWHVRPESCGCEHQPSSYLQRIWFDTLVYDPEHLRRLIGAVGAERLVIGTDYPFDMGHYDPIGLLEALPDLSRRDADAILSGNAMTLLDIESVGQP